MIAQLFAAIAVIGIIQYFIGWILVLRFLAQKSLPPPHCPAVTILRPLCGAEPLLEEALTSCFNISYPRFQIVFGIQDPADPALPVLRRVCARYPDRDVAIVVDSTPHGPNRKVSNLINMMPSARHDVLVISDSDIHVSPDYLDRLVAELEKPGTGLVTALYVGLAARARGVWERLGATQITHCFLPGVLLSRLMGRRDCLGSTTMLRREMLERIGGLRGLVTLLAEDNVMGQRVRDLGQDIRLGNTVVAATVREGDMRDLWQHETRWTRTIRILAPVSLAASSLQHPLFWALLAVLLSDFDDWALAVFLGCWLVRAVMAQAIDRALRRRVGAAVHPTPFWMFPLRDVLSVVEIAATYGIDEVVWRGHKMSATGCSLPCPD